MDDLDTWFTDEDYQNLDDLLKKDMFPLYTHPVKELTDEEIDNISDEIPHYIDTYMGRRMFAKAILRKAQEK